MYLFDCYVTSYSTIFHVCTDERDFTDDGNQNGGRKSATFGLPKCGCKLPINFPDDDKTTCHIGGRQLISRKLRAWPPVRADWCEGCGDNLTVSHVYCKSTNPVS